MKFGLIQEGHIRQGVSAAQRYAEYATEYRTLLTKMAAG